MSDQLQHPTLDGRPVMIGDLLEADHPDRSEGGPATVQFAVGSMHYDHMRPAGGPPLGWTVAPAAVDDLDFEWPLFECRRPTRRPYEVVVRMNRERPVGRRQLGSDTADLEGAEVITFIWELRDVRSDDVLALGRRFPSSEACAAEAAQLWPDLPVLVEPEYLH